MNKTKFIALTFSVSLVACTTVNEVPFPELGMENEITTTTPVVQITEDVSSAEVANILSDIWGGIDKSRALDTNITVLKDENNEDRIICVNKGNDGGFVLISALKSHMPILAYSDEGNFNVDLDEIPFPLNLWVDEIMDEINESRALPTDSLADVSRVWRKYDISIPTPLVDEYPEDNGFVNLTMEEYMQLSQIMMRKVNEWNSKGYRVYAINEYSGATSLGDKNAMGAYVQGRINPFYMDDYRHLTLIVEKDIDNSNIQTRKIKTKWTQENGYNQSLDTYWNIYENQIKNRPVGCGPLSLGQIMHSNRYPTTFDWDAMTISGSGNKVTADFLRELYIRCKTIFYDESYSYPPSYGSASVFEDRLDVLSYYGYTYDVIQADQIDYDVIEKKSPLMVSSFFNNDIVNMGHAWIIDGVSRVDYRNETEIWTFDYSNDFVCVFSETSNSIKWTKCYAVWGFEDNSDGYYDISKMLPSGQSYFANTFKVAAGNIKPILK